MRNEENGPLNGNAHTTHHHKRESLHRIFVNRNLHLDEIKFIGFDMDHTLAKYIYPEFESLGFHLAIDKLITMGYPKEIKTYEFNPSFAVRGLWLDKKYGNLLKLDTHRNVLACVHGLKILTSEETQQYYSNMFISFEESRIHTLDTLYELPLSHLYACIIDFFSAHGDSKQDMTGVLYNDLFISYTAIFSDVLESLDSLYKTRAIQNIVTSDIARYIEKNEALPLLLARMRENGTQVFLLTNSDYDWANKLMGFMLNDQDRDGCWRNFFDYVIVDARKPAFFVEGTTLKEINLETGTKCFGHHSGPFKPNRVYSGGSCDVFSKLIGSNGKDVLYVGDHIYGDIIRAKKEVAWRTFLIVPELGRELQVWKESAHLFVKLQKLEDELADRLINLDSSSKVKPNISDILAKIEDLSDEMDKKYSELGSAFRKGSTQTYFSSQITRYADIYASTHLNLLYYPFFYFFKSSSVLMPHESTTDPREPNFI